jgi:predicted RNase H-like nuclease (RuvC/YqgF family)
MDVQHSTAPLMRQLESTERQNRARAAAWAEVETKLRSDLEDSIIQIEKLTKERNDLVSSEKRSQRLLKEKEGEVASSRETIDELSATIETLETRAEELDEEGKRIQQELIVAERKASEGASKVRSEMMQTVVESEERYRSQIDALEEELDEERHRRGNLEKQLDDLVESVTAAEFAQNHAMGEGGQRSTDKEKKLLSATDQASILQDTLAGFDSDVDDDEGHENGSHQVQGQGGSFAAMEQLSLGLKGAKVELDALRKQLVTSEETRASLSEELGEARLAVEKLPLFEQKVSELTMEVKLKEMEIQGLQDDIADVRFLYRSQLDTLLEEKATTPSPLMPSEHDKAQNVRSIVFDDDSN